MTCNQIFETIIEGAMVLAVILGFIFEDKLVAFEETSNSFSLPNSLASFKKINSAAGDRQIFP